ncbi:hypothetical protein [Evansella tamaricis]|uniref:Uncharacterized protein n=1 Tax=Evansella tamaricis TaxID=2069301 RepID=A0ABS6JD17_9BACI|nr:hypothetical protein [Evansella tamaricis]MBU9710752.1 hypothetical protein [Evansella tamaricis]
MGSLPPSFLGKKVYLDGHNKQFYVVKYEEHTGKKKSNVLLFDQDTPVIFAVIHHEGNFLDSFYLTNKTTQDSAKTMERYKKIAERKKLHKVTQDDLRDALKPMNEARMKNENIIKHLVDEHLEDIKHLWPSRLLTLQKTDGKSNNSLILVSLQEALELANPAKAFQFLVRHRCDDFIPNLGSKVASHPNLIDDVTSYFLSYNEAAIVEKFLFESVKNVSVQDHDLIEHLLNTAKKIDSIYYSNVMRHLLSRLFKRVKQETGGTPRDWLNETIHDRKLKQSIVSTLKKKTG